MKQPEQGVGVPSKSVNSRHAADMQTAQAVAQRISSVPVLLMTLEHDDVVASRDGDADTGVLELIRAISELPHTHVAVMSRRRSAELQPLYASLPRVLIAGDHGNGYELASDASVPASQQQEHQHVLHQLLGIARDVPGVRVVLKPRGVLLEYRGAPEAAVTKTLGLVSTVIRGVRHLSVKLGTMVVEFGAEHTNKAAALAAIRHRVGASAVLALGSHETDEEVFRSLTPLDAGVHVGAGGTAASHSIMTKASVANLLERVLHDRSEWLRQRDLTPLQTLSPIGDLRTVALINARGSIVWLCLPRLDSPAIFAELLGTPSNGHFTIQPAISGATATSSQAHEDDSLVLRTQWPTFRVTDYFDCGGGRAFQRAGRSDLIRVIEGAGKVRITFAPRLDFGRLPTQLIPTQAGLQVEGGGDSIVLHAPDVHWTITRHQQHHTAEAVVDLGDKPLVLELRYGTPSLRPQSRDERQRRDESSRFWSNWTRSLRINVTDERHIATLRKSALLLRCLCYGPTGALAAAATTSLPEHLGGSRNWDYRFCWPRDGSMACAALLKLGNTGTALRFLDWLAGVVERCESPDRLRPVYTLLGADLGAEAEIGELAGYGGSKPVRVGNAAAQQVQLDVFGPIADLIASLAEHGAPLSSEHWRLMRAMVSAVEACWHEPDHGIWEIRGAKRHHIHTKAMCFHTVDRALALHTLEMGREQPGWLALREAIRADVLANGFNATVGSFTTAYGSTDLDASVLHVGLTGLLPATDKRWAQTVDAVQKHLRTGPVVMRYLFDDNLPGREGGFQICTSWLIESLLTLGRIDEADDLLNQMLALVGPTGTMTEEYDADYKIALGNLPQAYSHLALINAILAMHKAKDVHRES